MTLDPREFIRLHAGMPEHPKVDPLSDAAFRTLVEAWCLCRRTRNDGRIPLATWRKKWKPRARKELADAGLVHVEKDAAIMHDWLEHQPSVEALDEKRAARIEAGRKGGVRSGESRRGGSKQATKPEAKASGAASSELDQTVEQNTNENEPELEIEKEFFGYVGGESLVANARENDPPPRTCPQHTTIAPDCEGCARSAATREDFLRAALAATEPARYCADHPTGTRDACRKCQGERENHDRWRKRRDEALAERNRAAAIEASAAARESAELRAAAIAACPLHCSTAEEPGYWPDGRGGTVLCDHQIPRPERPSLRAQFEAHKRDKGAAQDSEQPAVGPPAPLSAVPDEPPDEDDERQEHPDVA